MLVGHPEDSSDPPSVFACALLDVIVETEDPLPDSVSELQDLLQRWPILVLFGHNRVVLHRLHDMSAMTDAALSRLPYNVHDTRRGPPHAGRYLAQRCP
jgi:hypothetical protein